MGMRWPVERPKQDLRRLKLQQCTRRLRIYTRAWQRVLATSYTVSNCCFHSRPMQPTTISKYIYWNFTGLQRRTAMPQKHLLALRNHDAGTARQAKTSRSWHQFEDTGRNMGMTAIVTLLVVVYIISCYHLRKRSSYSTGALAVAGSIPVLRGLVVAESNGQTPQLRFTRT